MLFSSSVFLAVFLPVVLLVYHGLLHGRRGAQNVFLLLASLFFYWWGEPKFVLIMLLSIAMNYLFGLWAGAFRERGIRLTAPVVCTVAANLAILFSFKYVDFTVRNLNLLGLDLTPPEILLPIGISFYTFQAMSYVFDIARGRGTVQKNPLNVGLYIALFPQLVAGPIVKYETVAREILRRRETWDDFAEGVRRFLIGLGKKVLLSNQLAVVADLAFAAEAPTASLAWLGAICYTLQIYYDFSGYSDMAIGLGRMFGFHFLENFNWPYISSTHHGVLAALAYLPVHLVPGLCIFPSGRQPGGSEMEAATQSACGVAADGHLARGQLDLYCLGDALFRAAGAGKVLRPGQGLACLVGPRIHAADGQLCLGSVPGGGFGRGCQISGGPVWGQWLGGTHRPFLGGRTVCVHRRGIVFCRAHSGLAEGKSERQPPGAPVERAVYSGAAGSFRRLHSLAGERHL